MVGGTVIEVIQCPEKELVWINCENDGDTCAVYVDWCSKALVVSCGDAVWWQSPWVFWTPKTVGGDTIGPEDVKIPKASGSGVSRPTPATT